MLYRDIELHVDWVEGYGFRPSVAPSSSGLYAQIYWPDRAVRIGQSSNIVQRLREATSWANAMCEGTAPEDQLRRTSALCQRVKQTGNEGFEYFLISDDPRFTDHSLRLEYEAFLFGWFQSNCELSGWINWNLERPRKELMPIFNEGAAFQPKDAPSGVVLSALSVPQLLSLHAGIGEALRERGVVRSANNPTGDLAEYLFCEAFGWEQAPNSERGFNATGKDGKRYQIKGRRIHRRNKSRQLSAIRDLSGRHFDTLAAVLFDDDFRVTRAALIPFEVIERRATYVAHTNSNRFMLRDDIWDEPDVSDVTEEIRKAMP